MVSIVRGGHGRGPARSRPPRSGLRGPQRAVSARNSNPESDPTDSGGGSPMREDTEPVTPHATCSIGARWLLAAFMPAAPAAASPDAGDDDAGRPGADLRQPGAARQAARRAEVARRRHREGARPLARPRSEEAPSGFNGADPASYGAGWAPYEAIVSGAQARGMSVMFQLGGTRPDWATPGKSAVEQPQRPRVRQVRAGRRARASRACTSGRCGTSRTSCSWLSPQFSGRRAAGPAHLPRARERRVRRAAARRVTAPTSC